jgi:hypothetical protein
VEDSRKKAAEKVKVWEIPGFLSIFPFFDTGPAMKLF